MSLSRLDLRGVPATEMASKVPTRPISEALPSAEVSDIIDQVRGGGDAAVRALTRRFDGVELGSLRVPADEVDSAPGRIEPALREALERAWSRILAYHGHEPGPEEDFESDGVRVRQLLRPVSRAGLYAPGGLARYPSTVLMCAAPARVAGVAELALCVPPTRDGSVAAQTLAAAAVAGVEEVYAIGGAQAVAAMALGTETLRPVDVVVGPGNKYVAEAKRQLSGIVGVPSSFAGPSEVVVVADRTTPAPWAAVDVVVQAEHGPDGLAWFVTWCEDVADEVSRHIEDLVVSSPRALQLEATLAGGGSVVLVDGPEEAMALANVIAPEHLELLVEDAERLLPLVKSAGAVFCGAYSPASLGDYMAGPNHVLPTARTARFSSALRVDDFRTHIHAVSVSRGGLLTLAPHVALLAEAEGLPAHALSVTMRAAALGGAGSSGTPGERR